ncbi:MAG: protease SohB [SAR324 cluster bacterium]|uniref:Protease SohB n=1 Tax=SAR324 cluster bacterium TaxID=2024889 RepID=A0A2A4T9M0_9DELT|nr:MAG: protease SohB [SAR324 cluster bacterium]
MDFLSQYGLFLAKVATLVFAVLITFGGLLALLMRGKSSKKQSIQIRSINEKYTDFAHVIQEASLPKKEFHKILKQEKAEQKQKKKKQQQEADIPLKRIFILNFAGDIRASAVESLREEITAILMVATEKDEILLRLESGGGMVHSYGLAASQLLRIKEKKIPLTITVDKVAASGGYMMACVADRLLAAPFAIIGSIGVIAQIPNFNRLLRKNNIEFEQVTAGEYKRTLTMFGENTKADRKKLQEELEETHDLFKDFITQYRAELDLKKIATGEHWYGKQALDLKLIDAIKTSDAYLLDASRESDLYEVSYHEKKKLSEKFSLAAESMLDRFMGRLQGAQASSGLSNK